MEAGGLGEVALFVFLNGFAEFSHSVVVVVKKHEVVSVLVCTGCRIYGQAVVTRLECASLASNSLKGVSVRSKMNLLDATDVHIFCEMGFKYTDYHAFTKRHISPTAIARKLRLTQGLAQRRISKGPWTILRMLLQICTKYLGLRVLR